MPHSCFLSPNTMSDVAGALTDTWEDELALINRMYWHHYNYVQEETLVGTTWIGLTRPFTYPLGF
jgi:hypothetical protein